MDEQMNNQPMPQNQPSSSGSLMIILVILAVLLVGGLYFWVERGGDMTADEATESIETQSESDDILDIEADLEATEVDSIDAELQAS